MIIGRIHDKKRDFPIILVDFREEIKKWFLKILGELSGKKWFSNDFGKLNEKSVFPTILLEQFGNFGNDVRRYLEKSVLTIILVDIPRSVAPWLKSCFLALSLTYFQITFQLLRFRTKLVNDWFQTKTSLMTVDCWVRIEYISYLIRIAPKTIPCTIESKGIITTFMNFQN